jgi:hypothetical protein
VIVSKRPMRPPTARESERRSREPSKSVRGERGEFPWREEDKRERDYREREKATSGSETTVELL